ncbi:hypothetical protein RB653_000591 [Dictyostelium firmibasis]|uniref:Uncharacterized protein n=1 Tax=Dictyostelium firmibasis TaxID=79012 RepID=A0AAN7U3K1_9MYCE
MGYYATKHDEFTTSDQVNKAVLGLSIVRLFIFFVIFILNLNQTIKEIKIAKRKKKYIYNARLNTYVSITIYPFSRLGMIGAFFYDKTIDNGSITVGISIWGTLFQYTEWVFIAGYWLSLLYTFFLSRDMVLKNTKKAWIVSYGIFVGLVIWTIIQTIFNFYNVDYMNATYGPGQIVIVVGIGGFYFINGVLLFRSMREYDQSKNTQLGERYNRIVKMVVILLILVVGVFLVYIIQFPVLGSKDYQTSNYAFYLISCLLEFMQLPVVMYSLGGDSFKPYFILFTNDETLSSKGYTTSGGGAAGYSANKSEISMEVNDSLPVSKNTETTLTGSTFNNISTNSLTSSNITNTSAITFNNISSSTLNSSTVNLEVSIDLSKY